MSRKKPTRLSAPAMNLLKDIQHADGWEVPKSDWHIARELVQAGKITLGPAMGPGNYFKRAEVVR